MNGSSPYLENIFQSLMQVNNTTMGVVGSHLASNAISFWEDISIFGLYVVHKGDMTDKTKPSDAVVVCRYKVFLDVA